MAIYLRIGSVGSKSDIQIKGDVTQKDHLGWIEIDNIGFGSGDGGAGEDPEADEDTENEQEEAGRRDPKRRKPAKKTRRTQQQQGPPGSGSQQFRESGLTITKFIGSESPKIIDWALTGTAYDIEVECCREDGQPFMRVTATEARVQKIDHKVNSQDLTEELRLLFETIAVESHSTGKDGKREKTQAATKSAKASGAAAAAGAAGAIGAGTAVDAVLDHPAAREIGEVNPDFIMEDRILSIDFGGIDFDLGSFIGSEQMSGLFRFRLEVTSPTLEIAAADVIGKPVAFRIEDDADIGADRQSDPREFHGIIAEIHAGQIAVSSRNYTLVVVPWAWLLTKRTNCRIFQKKTVVEILEAVLGAVPGADFDKSNVRGTYPKLDYCVQYRETDFAFVSRLLEENGIFYFFRFAMGSHKMVLADSSVAHATCDQTDVVQSHGSVEERHLRKWVKHFSHVSGKARYRDYNHTTPAKNLESEAPSRISFPDVAANELYEYPGHYANVADGKTRATLRIEAEEATHCTVAGDGNCDAFTCGTKFTVKDHECEEENGQEYVLTGVVHRVYVMATSDMKPRIYYTNDFGCIPKDVTYRPARTTPWPRMSGPQTAKVVGVSGEEIDPDKYASVKVQFPWDRDGKNNENSSCFVRVSQPIAGKNWGGLWLPRIGQEVVVDFLEGDPDRPLIVGSVYNEENLPPYALPTNKTQSGVKSRSSKDGKPDNFNELRFEDKKGSELVYMHAEKDFERVVENDDKLTVGKEGKGNQQQTIEKDRSIEVKQGNESYVIKKGNRTVTVETGNDTHSVKTGNREVTIDMGNDTLTVKMGNQTTKVNLGKSSTEAMQSIELKVGGSSIKVDQMGITMKGMMITVEGQVKTEVKGLMCQVTGSAMLKAGGGITMIG